MTVEPGPSRVERKRARRVAEVERVAARLFATKGYERTNFEDVAAELDLRGPSLYHYFSSKEELLRRCLRSSSDEVLRRLRAIADREAPAARVLHALFHEQVLIEVRDFPEFAALFLRMPASTPELQEIVLDVRRAHAQIFEQVARRVAAHTGPPTGPGTVDRDRWRVRLSVVFGALAYVPEWYDPAGPMGPETLADEMADTLLTLFGGGGPA